MRKLNLVKFKELIPCKEGYEYVLKLKTTDLRSIFNSLNIYNLDWSNWLIARLLSRKDKIRYAIFAAEQVIETFEKIFPEDKRPREAINAALKVLKNNTAKNRSAAKSAGSAAWLAAKSAGSAAGSAAWLAGSAAWLAGSAAKSAGSAAWLVWSAVESAGSAAMKLKIVEYGIELLGGLE